MIKGVITTKEQWEYYTTTEGPMGDYTRKMSDILERLNNAKTELIEYLRENGEDVPDGLTLREISNRGYIRDLERRLLKEQEATNGYKSGK